MTEQGMESLRKRYKEFNARRVNSKRIEMTPPRYDNIYYEALARMNEEDYPLGKDGAEIFNATEDMGMRRCIWECDGARLDVNSDPTYPYFLFSAGCGITFDDILALRDALQREITSTDD